MTDGRRSARDLALGCRLPILGLIDGDRGRVQSGFQSPRVRASDLAMTAEGEHGFSRSKSLRISADLEFGVNPAKAFPTNRRIDSDSLSRIYLLRLPFT